MPRIMTNGVSTYYEITGQGPAVIFASGLGGTAAYWAPQVDAFAQHFTVVTYDQRGAGSTECPGDTITMDMLADDLQALIEGLGLTAPFVVGHSTGGAIAQVLAARKPDILGGMVQYASWPKSDAHFKWCFRMRKALLGGSSVEEYLLGSAIFLYPPTYIRDHADRLSNAIARNAAAFPAAEVVIRRIDAITTHDSLPNLKHVSIPTLVLCAEDDILTPPYQARLLVDAIEDAELTILPSGGHGLSETEPHAFNDVTLAFIRKNAPDPTTGSKAHSRVTV